VPPLLIERRWFFDPARNPFFRHADVLLFISMQFTQLTQAAWRDLPAR
jgi:hypothetical protein